MREWLAAAIGSLLVLGSGGGQGLQERGKMPERERPASSTIQRERPASSTREMKNIDFACVSSAVSTREAALGAAVSTQQQSVAAAYAARATALQSAYSGSDSKAIKDAVKTAWKNFTTATKNAKQTAERSKKQAWEVFRTNVKSCKGSESISDAQNASSDQQ